MSTPAMPSADPRADACSRSVAGCGDVLRDDLGWALGVVLRSYVKSVSAAFAGVPGGARGYQVLASATHGEPRSQLELARHLGVDRTVMTYLLDDLGRAGLVERHPDPAGRRARRIAATVRGRELLGDLDQRLLAAEQEVLSGLAADEDRTAFRRLLAQLAAHAHALDPAHALEPRDQGACIAARAVSGG